MAAELDALNAGTLSDDELVEAMRAWRRVTSWAQAGELAVVAEFVRRREERHQGGPDPKVPEFIADEIALALTLSAGAARRWAGLACALADRLPLTRRALVEGSIDLGRAGVIADGLLGVDPETTTLVEQALIGEARTSTAGRLRHRVRSVIKAVNPEAAEQRRQRARKVRGLERWATAAGTCDLVLRGVSEVDAESVYSRINDVAQAMRAAGDVRPIDAIRHDLGVALLLGDPLPDAARDLRHAGGGDERTAGEARGGGGPQVGGLQVGGLQGRGRRGGGDGVSRKADRVAGRRDEAEGLTECRCGVVADVGVQIAGLLAEVIDQRLASVTEAHRAAGHGNGLALRVAAAMQAISSRLAKPKERWCEVLSGQATTADGPGRRSRGQERDRSRHRHQGGERHGGECHGSERQGDERQSDDHHGGDRHGHDGYRPPAGMRRLVESGYGRCAFPTCDRPAARCDLDHTIAWHQGGSTCPCNLSPLCRRHHRLKQDPGWRLFQPWPGLLVWVTPAGRWHTVIPERRR